MFYVYEWFNVKTREVFYVGKGCRGRYKQTKQRNKLFKDYYETNECDVRIIKEFDNEKDAFELEHYLITTYKESGLCKCNLDNGGKGGVNFSWTDEMREYYSQNNVMKRNEQRIRMSNNNPMKNSVIAKKVGEKHRRPFKIGDKVFQTQKEASNFYNRASSSIWEWLRKGISPTKEKCYYLDEYANQQPSTVNSSNSNSEGSTTNR